MWSGNTSSIFGLTGILDQIGQLRLFHKARNERIADHKGRRAIEPQGLRQLHGSRDVLFNLGSLHVLAQLCDIKADLLGNA